MSTFYQSAVDIEASQYANAEQPQFFEEQPRNSLTVQPFLMVSEEAPTPEVSHEQQQIPRPRIIESLERSLSEHGDVWAELARC